MQSNQVTPQKYRLAKLVEFYSLSLSALSCFTDQDPLFATAVTRYFRDIPRVVLPVWLDLFDGRVGTNLR
jgi:hypothetical protein